ncbi:hypothetical protein HDU79_000656 [Rhizoclosmatium sp. JEL0117]|nr:hypothetical protein HDU79_000656 [Rhizoclosmatium sp. JEL0117]
MSYAIPANQFSSEDIMSESETHSHASEDEYTAPSRRGCRGPRSQRKKAGRKSISDDAEDSRIARNRKAQREFRERKERYVQGLEQQVKEQAALIEQLQAKLLQQELLISSGSASPNSISKVSAEPAAFTAAKQEPLALVQPELCHASCDESSLNGSPLHSPSDNVTSFLFQQPPSSTFSSTPSLFSPDEFSLLTSMQSSLFPMNPMLSSPQAPQLQNDLVMEAYFKALLGGKNTGLQYLS